MTDIQKRITEEILQQCFKYGVEFTGETDEPNQHKIFFKYSKAIICISTNGKVKLQGQEDKRNMQYFSKWTKIKY